MISIKNYSDLSKNDLNDLFFRFGSDFSDIMINTVAPIANDVKKRGDQAVKEYTKKFDHVELDSLLVTPAEIEEGYKQTPPEIIKAFTQAKENITEFHSHQKKDNIIYNRNQDLTLGMLYQPIDSAAIYVPGGKAAYPSSVLMGVIPAKIAGVKNVTVITPPNKEGKIPAAVLAVCKIAGVDHIIKSGGAQGIAAAGFGTETIKKSDLIVGPGNIFVTAAKSYLFSLGAIQIDSLAGPSEVLIVADESAKAKWVAWDLLSQAEHEENATAILVTPSQKLAQEVAEWIAEDLESGRGRSAIKKTAIANHGLIIVTETLEQAIEFSNNYGPEHMEMLVDNPLNYLNRLKNIGSLFLGHYAPVAVGDYYSGTNHILPTGGAARFSSGLSVETFMRRTPFQCLGSPELARANSTIFTMAQAEGFDDKHGGSVQIRFEEEK